MLSSWSTHGALSYPVCQDQVCGSYLQHGQNMSWFDYRRCFLPRHHAFRRNKSSFTKNRTVHGNLHRGYSQMLNLNVYMTSLKWRTNQIIKFLGSLRTFTTGQSIVSFGTFHTGNTSYCVTTWLWCTYKKKFCENIINTVMNVSGKTKDNVKAWLDLAELCARDELHLRTRGNGNSYKPKAKYMLYLEQRRALYEWMHGLSLPDGYNFNFSNIVDPTNTKL